MCALPQVPDGLDPANAITLAAEAAGLPLFDTLISSGPASEPAPGLAERWSTSRDGLVYTFQLRPGVAFHDGTPFEAEAARYNLQRLIGDERPGRHELLMELVRDVQVSGGLALQVHLERPHAPFLNLLAQMGTAMVSPRAHRSNSKGLALHPIGTGPFRLVKWIGRGDLVLEAWEHGSRTAPQLQGAVLRPAPETGKRLDMLERGEIQLAGAVPLESADRVRQNPELRVDVKPSMRAIGIAMNTRNEPFNDYRVRQALNYAIDKEAIVRRVYGGLATPLGSPVAPQVYGAARLAPYPFDPASARRLLADAGHASGLEASLVASVGSFEGDVKLAREIQHQLEAIGVRIRLELLDQIQLHAAMTKPLEETQLQLALTSWLPPSAEARSALYPLFHSSQWMPRGYNTSFFQDRRFEDLLESAARAIDNQAQHRLYQEAQELLHEEAPWIFLVAPDLLVARSARLHDPLVTASEVVSVSERTWVES